MSIFTSKAAPFNTASYAPGKSRWASKPVTVLSVGWKEVRPHVVDMVAVCSDESIRKLRLDLKLISESDKVEARLTYRVLQDMVDSKTPLLFAVKGNNSERHWFCGFTDDFIEVETDMPKAVCPF